MNEYAVTVTVTLRFAATSYGEAQSRRAILVRGTGRACDIARDKWGVVMSLDETTRPRLVNSDGTEVTAVEVTTTTTTTGMQSVHTSSTSNGSELSVSKRRRKTSKA